MLKIPTTIKNEKLVARRREQLIKSGIKLFGRKGFHGTTLKDLAEDAGISYGNIYDYVGSKEDIFYLIHDFLYRKSMDMFNRSMEDLKGPIERLRAIIHCEFKIMDSWSDATLLMYQESHILKEVYLKELLQRERHRLEKMETIIAECVEQGTLKPCNVRLAANQIKSMLDSWVLKRWDLREVASRREAERAMLDFVLNGLARDRSQPATATTSRIGGGCALVVNSGTVLGSALCTFLSKKGLRVVSYVDRAGRDREQSQDRKGFLRLYGSGQDGPLGPELIKRIERENGPVNVYVQDMGVGNMALSEGKIPSEESGRELDENIFSARKASVYLRKTMARRVSGRIVFMAPWAWDYYLDDVHYEIAKASTVAMTEALSREMAPAGVNVNCVVPGFIKALKPSLLEKKFSDQVELRIPRGHMGEIQDVVDAVWFLIAKGSSYMTGQVLNVSGGI